MRKKPTVTIGIPAYKRSLQAGIKEKVSVTIGIPAYNEEANIGHLLKSLIKQKEEDFKIDKIIVSSDGSTDRTIEIVKSFKDSRIKLLDNKKRRGQASRQNQ